MEPRSNVRELLDLVPESDAEVVLYGAVIAYLFTNEYMELRTFIGAREANHLITDMSHARFSLIEQTRLKADWVMAAMRLLPSMVYVRYAEQEYQLSLSALEGLPMVGNYVSRNDLNAWIENNPEQIEEARRLYSEDELCLAAANIVFEAQAKLTDQDRLRSFPQRFSQLAPDPHTAPPFELLRFYTAISLVLGIGKVETSIVGSQYYRELIAGYYRHAVMEICADVDVPSIRDYISAWTKAAHDKLRHIKGLADDPSMAAPIVDVLNLHQFPHCGAAVDSRAYVGSQMEQIINELINNIYQERRLQWAELLNVRVDQVSAKPLPLSSAFD